MRWVDNIRKNNFAVWIVILLVSATLSIWLCSIIEIIGNIFFLSAKEVVVEESWLYEGTLQMWRSAYVIVIFAATGIIIASGMAMMLIPQSRRFVQRVKLSRDGHAVFEKESYEK